MTIQQALKKYFTIESELLLAHVLKQPKEFLYLNAQAKLTAKQVSSYTKLSKERIAGKPIAYLLGYKYFYGLKFKVNKHVLIPRPETEWLVEKALAILRAKQNEIEKLSTSSSQKTFRILDLGTGSGCIAISIAKHLDAKHSITATDISSTSLKVAQANALTHKVNIKFLQRDLVKNLPQKFDLIIANLPYIPKKEYNRLAPRLRYEPLLALVDSAEDLSLYERLLQQIPAHLNPSGAVLLEIDPSYTKQLKLLIKQLLPAKKIQIHKDLKNFQRFISIS